MTRHMTRQEKIDLLEELLKIEEKNNIGNLTRTERAEFQEWVRNCVSPIGEEALKQPD